MKILIFAKNWLGDLLFQFPAIEYLRKQYPDAEMICAAPERCREIAMAHPGINQFRIFDEKKQHRSWLAKLNFAWQLRSEEIDRAYLFHSSATRAFLLACAGIPERIGYAGDRSRWLSQAVAEPASRPHDIDYFLKLVAGDGALTGSTAYQFYYSHFSQNVAQWHLKRLGLKPHQYICFHLGANWSPKRWPVKYFARLADLLTEEIHLPILVTGGPDDQNLADELQNHVKQARVVSLAGKTTLQEAGAIFAQSRFVVTGDSGPMHIASGVGAPVVALFGPTDPKRTGPQGIGPKILLSYIPEGYSVPWYGEKFPEGEWLSGLMPEQVFNELKKQKWIAPDFSAAGSMKDKCLVPLSKKNMRILFVSLSNLGDVILTTPALTALKRLYPEAQFTVICGPRGKGIFEESGLADELIIYDKKTNWLEKLKFIKSVRKTHYDMVVDLRHSAIPWLVNAVRRSPVTRHLKRPLMRERHLELLEQMKINVLRPVPPATFFKEIHVKSLLAKLKREGVEEQNGWIVVAPVAASGLKTWRLEGFKEVIEKIIQNFPYQVILAGDNREKILAQPLTEVHSSRVVNMAGLLNIAETAALIEKSLLLISNDSALMHLGFEFERPVVAIFGPTHHEKYGRTGESFRIVREAMPCAPCEQPICRFERQACFEDLTSQKVFQACQELLHEYSVTA